MEITKQNSPNKITADNESVTELQDDVRVLISNPQRVLSQFHKCPFSSLNPKGEEGPFYLDVSKLIMCFVPVRPRDQRYCNIPSCWGWGEDFNILPGNINITLLTKSQRCRIWDIIQALVPNPVLTLGNASQAHVASKEMEISRKMEREAKWLSAPTERGGLALLWVNCTRPGMLSLSPSLVNSIPLP